MSMKHSSFPDKLPFWTKEMLNQFCQASVQVTIKKGSTILHPLMENQFLFLVESGVIDYRYFSLDGDAVTIQQIRPGELFGIKVIFNCESERRHFFVMADTDVRLWKMSKENFLKLMESDPEFSKGIIQYLVYYVDKIEQKLMHTAVLDNYQQLVLLLMDYAENLKNNTAVVRITQQNLANLLMLSRQSVSTHLSGMAKNGLIEVRRGQIRILNWDALTKELHK
ncbi:MAG: Crp/Fnr family transcriptional regulator [Oscillospiraceae bacterium]